MHFGVTKFGDHMVDNGVAQLRPYRFKKIIKSLIFSLAMLVCCVYVCVHVKLNYVLELECLYFENSYSSHEAGYS